MSLWAMRAPMLSSAQSTSVSPSSKTLRISTNETRRGRSLVRAEESSAAIPERNSLIVQVLNFPQKIGREGADCVCKERRPNETLVGFFTCAVDHLLHSWLSVRVQLTCI